MTETAPLALLKGPLRRVRGWLIGSVLAAATGQILLWIIALAVVSGAVDRHFVMDRPQRAILLILTLVGTAVLVYRALWRPLRNSPTDRALLWEFERQNPALSRQLLATWELTSSSSPGASPQLVQAAIASGVSAAATADWLALVNHCQFQRRLLLAGMGVACVIAMAALSFSSEIVGIWFSRNVLLTDREWPQDVHFIFPTNDRGVIRVPRDEEWPLEIAVTEDSARVPVPARFEDSDLRPVLDLEADPARRRYRGVLPPLTEPTAIRLIATRATSPWIPVELTDRPAVETLELIATPPAYTQVSASSLPSGGGPYSLLAGTTLTLRGTATKPLSKATLTTGDRVVSLTLSETSEFQTEVAARDLRDGEYRVELTDTEALWLPGESQPRPLSSRVPFNFRLKVVPDRVPQVSAKLQGISTLVTSRAMLPLEGEASDDFAVTRLALTFRHRGAEDTEEQTGLLPISTTTPLPAAKTRWNHEWDLEPLGLAIGTAVSFVVEAADNNPSPGPGLGKSTVFLVRVVSDEELRAALLAREKSYRVEFEKRIKKLDELRTEVLSLRAAVTSQADLPAERREQLAQLVRRQKTLGNDLAGGARRFEDLARELQLNRLETPSSPLIVRLTERIIAPLWKATTEQTPPILRALDRVRVSQERLSERDAAFSAAASLQQQLLESLRNILSHMESAEGFQEAINRLVEVQQAQEDVLKKTEAAKQEAIRRVLDGQSSRKEQTGK